jgi:hypothetical protein
MNDITTKQYKGFRLIDGTIDNTKCPHLHYVKDYSDIRCQTCGKRMPGSLSRREELNYLLARWNSATAPYVLRTDHEHKRTRQLARAIDNRIKRLGFYEDQDWKEWSSGARYIVR